MHTLFGLMVLDVSPGKRMSLHTSYLFAESHLFSLGFFISILYPHKPTNVTLSRDTEDNVMFA